MAAIDFDSYRLVKDFQAAGFTEAQAVARDALRAWQTEMGRPPAAKTFATKADLREEIARLRGELREEIASLRGELKTDIAETEHRQDHHHSQDRLRDSALR